MRGVKALCAALVLACAPGLGMAQPAAEELSAAKLWPNYPKAVPLWEKGAPGFEARKDEPEKITTRAEPENNITFPIVSNIHNPSLTPFLPEAGKETGVAVIIAPGGAHRFLTVDREGYDLAKMLAQHGVAAFVLKYRLANEQGSVYTAKVHSREDGQRSVRLIRSKAAEWKVNPAKVGIIGFSAGGEVVNNTVYQPGEGDANAADPIDRLNGIPNFQSLVYSGIRDVPETLPATTPPVFLLAAYNDRGPTNSLLQMAARCRAANVPMEIHIYTVGGHGFGVRQDRDMSINNWPDRFVAFLKDQKILEAGKK